MENKKYFEAGIYLTGYVRLGVYADTPEEATKIVKDYCDNKGIDSSWIHIASLEVSNVEEESKRSDDCGHVININIQKFKVGDIVKIVKGYMGNRSDTIYVGCTGEILYVDIDDTVFVKLPSCRYGYWFDNDAVELIAEAKEDKSLNTSRLTLTILKSEKS